MKSFDRKVLAGMAVTILALAAVAPLAEAGSYRYRTSNSDYYRGPVVIRRSYPAGGYYHASGYYRGSSSVGPALAGLGIGLVLGTVLTNHANQQQMVYRDSREYRNDCGNGGYSSDRTYERDSGYYGGGYYGGGYNGGDDRYYRNDDRSCRNSDRSYRNDDRNYQNDDRYYRNDDRRSRDNDDGDDN